MPPEDDSWTRYETIVLDGQSGDRVNAPLAHAMRNSRLSRNLKPGRETAIWETATDVIGPFMFSYVLWILDKARREKLSTVYFVSRDGQILYKVALELEKLLKYNVNLKYIYGSRKAWHLPGFVKLDDCALSWILDSGFCSAKDICERANIQIQDIKGCLDQLGISDFERNLSSHERHSLGHLLENSVEIESKIDAGAEKLRRNTVRYLRQVGFAGSSRVGVVDIGWRGMLQRSLCQMLEGAKMYPEEGMATFYVALMNECQSFDKESRYAYFDKSEFKEISNFHLFEIFSSADHGTCLGYEENAGNGVAPVLKETRNTSMIEWGIDLQQEGITSFVSSFISELSKEGKPAIPEMKDAVMNILRTFSRKPSREEAEAYGSVEFCDDQEERSVFRTAARISGSDALRYPFAHDTSRKYGLWPEGTFRISFGAMFPFYALLLRLRHVTEGPFRHQQK